MRIDNGFYCWVYIESQPDVWTVGFYAPDGQWKPESDWHTPNDAGSRVAFLNGGVLNATAWAELAARLSKIEAAIKRIDPAQSLVGKR